MKIISYNVNGIRAAIKKDLLTWLETANPDVICFQETKAQAENIDMAAFEALGYMSNYWHSAEKKGYSGVLTLSKTPATDVIIGMNLDKYDREGRVLRTDFGDITLLNCYFPSGSSGEERHQFKLEFLEDFLPFVEELKKTQKNIIVVGDYNIVHQEMDIHNPKRKDKPSGYRPEEREWLDQWFNNGFNDAFRTIHPEAHEYSWWSYRARARANNKGWRIDYISVSDALKDQIQSAKHHQDAVHSDHCPVEVVLELK